MHRKPDFEWAFPPEQEWHGLYRSPCTEITPHQRTLCYHSVFVERALLLTAILLTSYYLLTKAGTNIAGSDRHIQPAITQTIGTVQADDRQQTAEIQTLATTLLLETAHLTFSFKERDQAVLTGLAGQLEELYVALHRLLALEPMAVQPKVAIEVTPEAQSLRWAMIEQRIVVYFPSTSKIADKQAKALLLGQLLREAVITYVWEEAAHQFPVKQQWQLMMYATKSWLLQCKTLPLPPLIDQAEPRLAVLGQINSPQLNTLFFRWGSHWRSYVFQQTEILLAQRLIDYSVQTYGPTSLTQLLRAFGQYDSWATLIPAVFEKTAEEFESDWRAHLASERDKLSKVEWQRECGLV